MKRERNVLLFSITINIIVATLKIVGGMIFHSYTLIVDGYYTICDLITDFIALIGAKVGRRRANKKFPFGFGRVEYISQMIIGLLILSVGIVVIILSFGHSFEVPNINILYLILLVIFLKILSSNFLMKVGKDIRSQILVLSAKESFMDVISSSVVFIIIIVGQFFPIIDLIGCISIAILVIISGGNIIIENVIALIGEDDNNKEIKEYIKEVVEDDQKLKYSDSFLIKSGSYYQVTIEIAVDEDMRINDLLKYELKVEKKLKKSKYKIKFIEFNIIAND